MNLSEKDARLRYFYLQDTEALTQNIAEKWVAKTHSSLQITLNRNGSSA